LEVGEEAAEADMPDRVKHPKPHRRLVQEPMVFGQGLGHARLIDDLAQMRQDRFAEFAEQDFLALTGTPVRYIRSTFAPDDGRCMCLFEAASDGDVKRLNDEAGIPYKRIVKALDLTP
jgi:hypothetical protein